MKHLKSYLCDNRLTIMTFIAVVAWASVGIFPLVSYESDAISIITAVEHPGYEGYGQWMQPLLYKSLEFAPAGKVEAAYSLLTAICAMAVIWVSMRIAQRITGLKPTLCLCALLLIPESYYLAMYPNSSAPALLCFLTGALLTLRGKNLPGAMLIAIAPLFRLDVVTAYPVMLPIYRLSGQNWKKALLSTALLATLVTAVSLVFYGLTEGSIMRTFSEYKRWNNIITLPKHLLAVGGFYSPIGGLLTVFGLWTLKRKRLTLIMLLTAMISVHLFEIKFGNASKHYATLLPFAAAAVASALHTLLNGKKWLRYATIIIVVASQLTGITIKPTPLDNLSPKLLGVFGTGQNANTCDEIVVMSGNLFYPLLIHNIKEENEARTNQMAQIIKENGATCVAGTWDSLAKLYLLSDSESLFELTLVEAELPRANQPEPTVESRDAFVDSIAKINPNVLLASPNVIDYKYDLFLEQLHNDSIICRIAPHIYRLRR